MTSGRAAITPANRGPWINIITWTLLVFMVLSTMVKLFSKWVMVHELQYDDMYIFASALVAIGYGIAVSVQVANGLGQHLQALSGEQAFRFQKAAYASQILYAISLCLAKLTILHFLRTFARLKTRRSIIHGVMVFQVMTTIAAILSIAFQCSLPDPWKVLSSKCLDQNAFWDSFGTLDVLVDAATVVISVYLLHDVHLSLRIKIPATLAFSSRALMIPIIVLRLVFLNNSFLSRDRTFDDFSSVLLTSIHIHLSVIVTCMSFLKPVMDGLQTGVLAGDVRSLTPIHPYLINSSKNRLANANASSHQNNRQNKIYKSPAGASRGLSTDRLHADMEA